MMQLMHCFVQGLRAALHGFLQQQGPQLVAALLRAAADSCPSQLLRPLSLLLHPLLSTGPLQAAREQLVGQALADPAFPGTCWTCIALASSGDASQALGFCSVHLQQCGLRQVVTLAD